MEAFMLKKPCKAQNLKINEINCQKIKPGHVLVKIKAFGINRSEIYTKRGDSPNVKFPRVIGIELAGEIFDASNSNFKKEKK
ncbi:hypothetical protein ALNOE001_00250 [Candidatus Methanobinarius endosymbioticus]|uniref:Alcohol dehydrogenase-like N-terminal domain-containing protein n=1 Tax=Candidatus Methanobinarius endosymbioticus TaxID=2006182 RepID=A0A366MEA1_9EURY|nr:hypothetical protein ALNOE001_00250 [Candidatus Methanobinarius endosymbioticus]